MRQLKCILSILLGLLLGLFASCTSKQNPEQGLEKPQDEQPTEGKENPEPPEKENDLPVRRPMLE
ncbi:MAG: hypothetical protein QGH15_12880 [Kiritimatiellia bacterium]|jgi:hypothetical protein|nr:hypothetical protein [Kiritimatiellia bacterium]